MRIQLWSYNYDPEPSGIAPLSGVWARAMQARGHEVEVVAAHPHYPEPQWGRCLKPYREVRDGVRVLRLPLWVGRGSAGQRMRQEASFASVMTLAATTLRTPDVIVAVSPSFPALVPAMMSARARGIPWMLWLQDILPDGALACGILKDGLVIRMGHRLERAAYRSASKIVVISESFEENLRAKSVDRTKIVRVYNSATRPILEQPRDEPESMEPSVLTMGNIGYTQNLLAVTRSFEDSARLRQLGARLVMAGDGQAGDAVRSAIRTDRVRVTGIMDSEPLERELRAAKVAVVSQGYDGFDFNVPSKLMNFMGYGIPTVASVRPDSEVARIIKASRGGWVTDSSDTGELVRKLEEVLTDTNARKECGRAALAYAQTHFSPDHTAQQFEEALTELVTNVR